MGGLVDALAARVRVTHDSPVAQITPAGRGFKVAVAAGATHEADAVIVAVPPNRGAPLVGARVPKQREARVAVVALGYEADDVDARVTDSYGYLAPESETRFSLGVLFESSVFPERAPPGKVLVRAMVGGIRHPERAALTDEELVAGVHGDLSNLRLVRGAHSFARVVRPGGIPQIELGHALYGAALAKVERDHPGLRVCGVGWRAVAMLRLVEDAERVAGIITRKA